MREQCGYFKPNVTYTMINMIFCIIVIAWRKFNPRPKCKICGKKYFFHRILLCEKSNSMHDPLRIDKEIDVEICHCSKSVSVISIE